jgi:hypothetical protein
VTRTPVVSLLLAAWLGAGILFASVVAPAAFAVLPTRTMAGALVGRVLPVLFVGGIVVAVLGLALDRGRGGAYPRVRRVALLTIAGACAVAQFGVAPRIERVRQQIGGPIEQLAPEDPRRSAFGRLHALSVAWLGVAMLGAATAIGLASFASRGRPSDAPGASTTRADVAASAAR